MVGRCLLLVSVAAVILLPYVVLLPPAGGPPSDESGGGGPPKRPSGSAATATTTAAAKATSSDGAGDGDPPNPMPVGARGTAVASGPQPGPSCAICFFGLPRSFRLLVLPSIVRNVLLPNLENRCDIYLHYFRVDSEEGGRSGVGGVIDPDEVWLLQNATDRVFNGLDDDGGGGIGSSSSSNTDRRRVHVSIVGDTNETFWRRRGSQLERYMTDRGPDGKLLYFPWMAKTYDARTVHNVVKQWHSISEVWQEMERSARRLGREYARVAMLRNDVVYVTPFDVHQISSTSRDVQNEVVAVPNWARYPVNDRMVYGPYEAVRVWATERFDRLESHVRTYDEPGYGLHSERFLDHSIFPAIRALGYRVEANPEVCFFRARADGSVWISDCVTRNGAARGFRTADTQALVEALVGHPCVRSKFNRVTVQLHCGGDG